jgi:hypothetical protein
MMATPSNHIMLWPVDAAFNIGQGIDVLDSVPGRASSGVPHTAAASQSLATSASNEAH